MPIVVEKRTSERLRMSRVTADTWILRVLGAFAVDALDAFREAFRAALECDVRDLVVDLGSTDVVSVYGAAALVAAADVMRARGGALWIAAAWPGENGYTLRPIRGEAREGLAGICAPLDDALDRVRDTRTNVVLLSAGSTRWEQLDVKNHS